MCPRESPIPGDYHIVTASNPSPYTLEGTNTYVIGGPAAVVVDPGPDDPEHVGRVLDRTRRAGWSVRLILVTHAHGDHAGAAPRLSEATGAPVGQWRAGDRPLEDGQVVESDGVRLRAVYTPGHAPDHVAFLWEGPQLLFSGDLILGRGTVMVAPPGGSMEDYLRSLERVAGLDVAAIGPGHGPLVTDPKTRIAEYIAHRRERELQVLDVLMTGPRTSGEVAASLYPDLGPLLHPAAEGTVLAHLLKLLREGRVLREGNRYYLP
jgi:glyoxylase-like metal-dependent hydrolase (beta-lactamase superfamily II)